VHGEAVSASHALQWLQDREALRELMVDYFCGVDDRNFERVGQCFASDVRANYGKTFEGRDDVIDFIRGVRFFHTTLHCMGAQLVDLAGDEARMVTWAMLTHHGTQGDGEAILYNNSDGRYVDVLTRRDSESGASKHLVGNQEIELQGDEARVRSYVYRTRVEKGRESHWSLGPQHWHDRLERRGGTWHIAEHRDQDILAEQAASAEA
jgi:hypothetical protein